MLEINKNYVLDINQKPIAVQIPIAEFEQIEEILEDYGLGRLIDETFRRAMHCPLYKDYRFLDCPNLKT